MPGPSAADRRALVAVAAATAFVLVVALGGASSRSFWVDEVRSVELARDWSLMWRELTSREANMWLYYVALHAWMKLFGESELAVRALSALSAAASIPVVYAVATRLFARRVGVLAAVTLASSAFFVRYGQEARAYAMLALFVLATTWSFIALVERPSIARAAAWAVLSVLAVYVHFFALIVTGAQLASLALVRGRRRLLRPAGVALVLALALALPAALYQPLTSGQVDWIAPVSLVDVARVVLSLAGGTVVSLVVVGALALLSVLGAVRRLRSDGVERWGFALALTAAWAVAPIVVPLIASLLLKPLLVARYAIIGLPAIAILVALGIDALGRTSRIVATIVVLAVSAHAIHRWPVEGEDWRVVARVIADESRPSDGVVVFAYHLRAPLEHYLAKALPPEARPSIVESASGPYSPGGGAALPDPDVARLASLPERFPRVWLVLGHDHLEHIGRVRQSDLVRDTLSKVYTLERRAPLGTLRVLLFARPPAPPADGAVEGGAR
ncbi:glycosyltransferase family 39 protein [Myxococcota bacterium]|nr:glycosyltransferase family 39 protein [Myxococcota bacterium]